MSAAPGAENEEIGVSIEDRVKGVMSGVLGVDADSIGEDTSVDTVPDWDSIRQINLVLALEDEFGLLLPEDRVVDLLSYPIVVETIREAVAANA